MEEEEKVNEQETQSQTENKVNKSNLTIFIILGVFALVVVGVFLFLRKGSSSSVESVSTTQTQESAETVEDTSGEQTSETKEDSDTEVIEVEAGSYFFNPKEIRVKRGEKVRIVITNKGGMHDFVIDELDVSSGVIQDGQTKEVEFTPDEAGTFEFYCSIANHRAMGMKGNLIVE